MTPLLRRIVSRGHFDFMARDKTGTKRSVLCAAYSLKSRANACFPRSLSRGTSRKPLPKDKGWACPIPIYLWLGRPAGQASKNGRALADDRGRQ